MPPKLQKDPKVLMWSEEKKKTYWFKNHTAATLKAPWDDIQLGTLLDGKLTQEFVCGPDCENQYDNLLVKRDRHFALVIGQAIVIVLLATLTFSMYYKLRHP